MTTERIDIVISENGSRTVVRNLDDVATSANRAGFATLDLSNALSKQEKQTLASALGAQKLSKAYADTARANSFSARANNEQAISLNKLVREQEKTSTSIVMNSNKVKESAETTAAKIATANQRLLDVTAQGAARTNAIVTSSMARNDAINAKSVAAQQFNAAKIVNLQATSSAKVDAIRTASIARNDAVMALSAAKQAESQARIQLTAARTAEVQERSALRAQKAIKETEKSYFSFENVMKTTTMVAVANEVRKAADEYTELQNKLRALGVAQADLGRTTDRLVEISNKSLTTLDNTATLYARLIPAIRDLGGSQNDLMTFTQAASQSMTLFGTSGSTATGAMLQLSQAMTRGKVQAQEFRSLQDGMYPLLQVVAKNMDGLGGSVAQLREKMLQGKLMSKEFFDAAVKGAPELELAMSKIAPTTSQVMTVLQNEFTVTIGKINQSLGVTRLFADAVLALAPKIPVLISGVIGLAVAFGVYSAAAALATVTTGGLYGAIGTLVVSAMTIAVPFAAVAAAIAGITTALYVMRNDISVSENSMASLSDLSVVIANDISSSWSSLFNSSAESSKNASGEIKRNNQGWFLDTANFIDMTTGAFKALGVTILNVWYGLGPAVSDIMEQLGNDVLSKINGNIEKLNSVSPIKIDLFNVEGGANAGKYQAFMETLKSDANAAFTSGVGATDWANKKIAEAEMVAKARIAALGGQTDPSVKMGEGKMPTVIDKKAEAEANKFASALERLRDKYDGVYKAQSAMSDGVKILDRAVAEGKITAEDRTRLLAQMNAELRDQADPLGAVNRELNDQAALLTKTSDEQEIANQMKKINNDLIKQGISQAQIDAQQYETKLRNIQRETEISRIRNQLLDETINKERTLSDTRAAIAQLEAGTPAQKLAAEQNFQQKHKELIMSQAEIDRMALSEQVKQIEADHVHTLKGEKMYALAMRKIKQQEQMITLNQYSDFFGTVATMMSSHNKRAFEIGKAAAIAQAVIQTYMSATAAYASASTIPVVGWVLGPVAAAAAIAAGMANVSQIRSQQMPAFAHGGAMMVGGTGGTDSQVVSLRATPGEVIRVTTPQQEGRLSSEGGGGATYNFNMPGITNATQARKSRSQIQRSVVTTVSTGKRFK